MSLLVSASPNGRNAKSGRWLVVVVVLMDSMWYCGVFKLVGGCVAHRHSRSLVGECYSSVGSRLFSMVSTLGVSCISGLTCSVIVRCNFVYVLSIFVDTSVMFRSVCSVSFLTYQGALVIRRRTNSIFTIMNLCFFFHFIADIYQSCLISWLGVSFQFESYNSYMHSPRSTI
jgi:hypothetical protein